MVLEENVLLRTPNVVGLLRCIEIRLQIQISRQFIFFYLVYSSGDKRWFEQFKNCYETILQLIV
jgi:hypothetical protein